MDQDLYTIALINDVFFDDAEGERLHARLAEAKRQGADLAVLPELPLNPWSPARQTPADEDAEAPDGPRHRRQAAAAREAGIAVLGGAIVQDPHTARRYNTALLFDASGEFVTAYRKLHLPEEDGVWETYHYEPGREAPRVVGGLGPSVGIQICSDINRPAGAQLLAAQGVEIVLAPRATPGSSYPRWRLVYQAVAVTSTAYIVSVNRPRPEGGVPLGGPSLVVSPDGNVILETEAPVAVVRLDVSMVHRLRKEYPGYMPFPASVYAEGWQRLATS